MISNLNPFWSEYMLCIVANLFKSFRFFYWLTIWCFKENASCAHENNVYCTGRSYLWVLIRSVALYYCSRFYILANFCLSLMISVCMFCVFHLFAFNLCVSLILKWVSYRLYIIKSYFKILPYNLYLLIVVFNAGKLMFLIACYALIEI